VLPALGLAFGREWNVIALFAAVAVLVIILHRKNIKRLVDRTESKFSFKRSS
jgi:glycerol-3-phosphate acyltransferase PlsY